MSNRKFWIPISIMVASLLIGLAAIGQTPAVKPVIVRDIDNADKMEQVSALVGAPASPGEEFARLCGPIVPAGKRLVIEHLSARGEVPTGQHASGQFSTQGSPMQIVQNLTLSPHGPSSASRDLFVASTPFSVRLPAASTPCVTLSRYPTTGTALMSFTYSGYYVDVP